MGQEARCMAANRRVPAIAIACSSDEEPLDPDSMLSLQVEGEQSKGKRR